MDTCKDQKLMTSLGDKFKNANCTKINRKSNAWNNMEVNMDQRDQEI